MQAPTSSQTELQQALDDVERDLRELTTNNLLKDITPELEGWAAAVRSAITEGVTAGRFALAPRQRDKASAIRRQIGEYARMARLVGALTPTLSPVYRKFAQSLDEVAAVLLVLMGEALANLGFSGGRFLLQVPYTELQVRREAAVHALRNLVGATQDAYGPNDWPRGQSTPIAPEAFTEPEAGLLHIFPGAVDVGYCEVHGTDYIILKLNPTHDPTHDLTALLTERELEVAILMALGWPNKQIADKLHISEWIVSTHLRRIYAKLGVHNRAAMVYRCTLLDDVAKVLLNNM